MKQLLILMCFLGLSTHAAGLCDLVGTEIYAQDLAETFLGVVSDNPYATTSILNKYGPHGSKYSASSILNEYGTFGGKYSAYSPFNQYTTTPPVIVDERGSIAYLSKNRFLGQPTVDPDALLAALAAGCGGVIVPPTRTKPDLIVDSLQAIISKGGDSLYFRYIIANVGAAAAPAFSVGLLVNGKSIGPINFPAIAAGYYEFDIRGVKLEMDSTAILIGADVGENIAEESEENNLGGGLFETPRTPTATKAPRRYHSTIPMPKGFNLLGRRSH